MPEFSIHVETGGFFSFPEDLKESFLDDFLLFFLLNLFLIHIVLLLEIIAAYNKHRSFVKGRIPRDTVTTCRVGLNVINFGPRTQVVKIFGFENLDSTV